MLNQINLNRIDLNLLVLFEAVIDECHIGRAASRLNLTPSAVSHGVARLRKLLNDPLFLRTPKGVVPTARALELVAPIAEILARVRSVVSTAAPFDPATSARRFAIGAPDAILAVIVPRLRSALQKKAPGLDISLRQLLPVAGETSPERAWQLALDELEQRVMDIAILPTVGIPARFVKRTLYEEDFVVAVRKGHAFAKAPDIEHYCRLQHLLVTHSGDPYGFVDHELAKQGRRRRVALTAPNFMFALSVTGSSDLLTALPRRFVADHGSRFGVVAVEPPVKFERFKINGIVPKVSMMDAGLKWLFEILAEVTHSVQEPSRRWSR